MYQNIPTLTEAYEKRMQALAANQAAYTPEQAVANNGYSAVTTQSALDGVNPNYYANYAQRLKQLGYSPEEITTLLQNSGQTNQDALQSILNQIYG